MEFPKLTTSRTRLTPLSLADEADIFALFSNEELVKYYDLAAFSDIAQAKDLIEFFNKRFADGSGIRWAIRCKSSNQLMGTCGFNSWSQPMKNASIGYDLAPKFWRQGYAFEAVGAIIEAAFSGLLPCGPIHRIQADTVLGNTSSEALLSKLGFNMEGVRRESGYWKGQFHDLKCFGLLASEFNCESLDLG